MIFFKLKLTGFIRLIVGIFFSFCLFASVSSTQKFGKIEESGNMLTIRIIRSYASTIFLQCPLASQLTNEYIRIDQIRWLNEINDFKKPDQSVYVTSQNLLLASQINLQLNDALTYVSCGYMYNNCYIRLKMWRLIYIDDPCVQLSINNNPNLISYNVINDTFSSVSVTSNPNEWNKPLELFKLNCINNFDYPVNSKYIWMYVYDSETQKSETWHKYDTDKVNENIYQEFHNPDTNKVAYLSEFIKNVLTKKEYYIKLQCGTYFERYNIHEMIYLLGKSQNKTIIKGQTYVQPIPSPQTNNGALIGGIVGGVLGFLLLLLLTSLLVWCCCFRKKNSKREVNESQITETKSSTLVFPGEAVSHTNFHSVNYVNTADKSSQFTNHLEISNLNLNEEKVLYDERCNTIRSAGPDVYLKMLNIQNDNHSNNSNNEFNIQYELYNDPQRQPGTIILSNGQTYITTDEETYKKDFYIHNYQQQHHQISSQFI